jgi:hypothetical protein
MVRSVVQHWNLSKGNFLALCLVAAFLMTSAITSAQDATPESIGSLAQIGTQTTELNGKDKIWQIDTITAIPKSQTPQEFKASLGFVFANLIPVLVSIDGADPVELAVGEALPLKPGDKVTITSTDETLGSAYTIELIELLEINTELNRQVIGTPFSTERADYTITLSLANLVPGGAVPLRTVELPALALVLEGELVRVREDSQSAVIGQGDASAGFGSGTMASGEDGAIFLLAEISKGDAAGSPVAQ